MAGLLLLCVILSAAGVMDSLLGLFGLEALNGSNRDYLQAAFDESVKGFIILSALKCGVAVLEGSHIGVPDLMSLIAEGHDGDEAHG